MGKTLFIKYRLSLIKLPHGQIKKMLTSKQRETLGNLN